MRRDVTARAADIDKRIGKRLRAGDCRRQQHDIGRAANQRRVNLRKLGVGQRRRCVADAHVVAVVGHDGAHRRQQRDGGANLFIARVQAY